MSQAELKRTPLTNPVSEATHTAACRWQLERVREQLATEECDAVLLYNPVNIRYATDTRNM